MTDDKIDEMWAGCGDGKGLITILILLALVCGLIFCAVAVEAAL